MYVCMYIIDSTYCLSKICVSLCSDSDQKASWLAVFVSKWVKTCYCKEK